jgi:hypothetical protein
MLFRRPLYLSQPGFINNITNGTPAVFTKEPLLADAFCLLKSRNIFPALDQAFKVAPDDLDRLLFSNNNFSIPDVALAKFDKLLPANFAQLNPLYIVNETALKIYIRYDTPAGGGGPFSLGLSDGAAGRKPWEMTNREVDIVVEVGPLKPLLTVHGTFHADPDGTPRLESPELEWGGDEGLQCMVRILELLSNLSKLYNNTDATLFPDGIKFIPSNAPDSWEYKCSIDQKIPVIQFPDTQFITLTGPPPMIIEASLSLGVFFSLSLNPGNPGMIKPSAGVSFTFEGALQIELITIEAATAYAFGSARVRIEIDILDPAPSIELTVGFGASVAIQLPVIGVVSVTRTVSITSSLSEKEFLVMAGTMLRGKLSLAGGLLTTSIQIEGSAGVKKTIGDDVVKARLDLIFTLDVSLAFVISYDFTRHFSHEVPFTSLAKL